MNDSEVHHCHCYMPKLYFKLHIENLYLVPQIQHAQKKFHAPDIELIPSLTHTNSV